MNFEILKQLPYFKRINIPKYIEARLQETALKHLKLPDMGKLRDRMEGQLYYDKLKTDVFAEYAFEKLIGIKKFDWQKRDNKDYQRKKYNLNGKVLTLVTFIEDNFPKLSSLNVENSVFVYVNTDNTVFVSGIATKSKILEFSKTQTSNIIEIFGFDELKEFTSQEDVIDIIE